MKLQAYTINFYEVFMKSVRAVELKEISRDIKTVRQRLIISHLTSNHCREFFRCSF